MQAKPLNGVYYEVVGGLEEDEIIKYDTCEKTEKEMKEYAWNTERTCFLTSYENGVLVEQKFLTGDISYEKRIGETYYEPLPREMRFRYQMLSRLKSDCDYFLGNGGRYEGHLWAGTVDKQIAEMKRRWLEFEEDEKPEWLTWEDIEKYEREMKKYPKYIRRGEYIGVFQRIDPVDIPIYRFPGGDSMADNVEIQKGSFSKEEIDRQVENYKAEMKGV